ncbi:MAG: LLM class F420-dependent oxidoreductase [Gammaproteobacteria bacterium]|mgnify:CR=1 FL=1|nr:LLM class F420-dependent oxidoreductase [Gammaproteobacteria bacterium]MBS04656.1 LLM class F420-dependent oxidoreductase [Gammaproteobacteria bacterium]|tara:strand:+ start:1485 stop:2324 length:840 start_codon:yes stop_codon:yes gene_type:complete
MANFGVSIFPTDQTIDPVTLAKAVEERGFDSLFVPEHTHIPTSRATPFPGGGDLPDHYWRAHDPFCALSAAAAVTDRIRLGTGICLVVERDPITLAKECASLDVISGGRFILGIGAGWNAEEMENHGASYRHRWAITREKILAIKAIWNEDEAEFHGEHVNFDPIWSWPKPVQAGGPPIWLGANSRWCYDRVAEYCDGWLPIGGPGSGGIANMRAAVEKAGRNPDEIELALFAAPRDPDQLAGRIEQGFSELVFGLPQAPADKVLAALDSLAETVARIR